MPARQGPRLVLLHADHPDAVTKCIFSHPINHAIQVLLPWPSEAHDTVAAPLALTQLRGWSSCHQLATVSLSALLDPPLMQRLFATDGVRFQALSTRGQADQGDTAAVTPAGLLRLSVCKDTYQQLGLVGKKSVLAPGACLPGLPVDAVAVHSHLDDPVITIDVTAVRGPPYH